MGPVQALTYNHDGTRLALVAARDFVKPGDKEEPTIIRISDASTGRGIQEFNGPQGNIKGLALTREGTVVALDTAETLLAWNVTDKVELFAIRGPAGRRQGWFFQPAQTGFAVSADGRHAASLSTDAEIEGIVRPERTVNLWDGDGKTCRVLDAKAGPLRSVGMSPDGARVIVASTNKQLLVIDFATGRVVESFFPGPDPGMGGIGPYFLAFSPDGAYFVIGKKDGVLQMYKNEKNLAYVDRARGPRAFIRAVAFLPDRLRVVSGGIAEFGFERHPNGAETWKYEPLWVWDVLYRRNPQGIDFQHPKP